jgi:dephospho-CoA kinase
MLHPLIREQARESMDTGNRRPYQILVVPLLFESGFDSLVDHVIAIDCPAEVQLQRLVTRDGISRQLARQMIDAQMTNDERRSRADTTIGNADNTDRTGRVLTIHQELSASGQGNAGVT